MNAAVNGDFTSNTIDPLARLFCGDRLLKNQILQFFRAGCPRGSDVPQGNAATKHDVFYNYLFSPSCEYGLEALNG